MKFGILAACGFMLAGMNQAQGGSIDVSTYSFIPEQCGSVCAGPFTASNPSVQNGDIVSSNSVLDSTNYSYAYANIATGDMGTAFGTNPGDARTSATHFDTWNCSPSACAALEAAGSVMPLQLTFHIAASGSLTHENGYLELDYSYQIDGLLGSPAGGTLNFQFFEDPGLGPDADIEARADFFDNTTHVDRNIPVIFSPEAFNSGQFAFAANATINTFIGGCPVANCDLTGGIFNDTQQLTGIADDDGDTSAEQLDSTHTFSVGVHSDLPLTSEDGRLTTAPVAVATPEPATMLLAGLALIAVGLVRRR